MNKFLNNTRSTENEIPVSRKIRNTILILCRSSLRASLNVFVFFVGMVSSYYIYSNYVAGFLPKSYAMIWVGFTAISPFLAFICWYAKGESKISFMLSVIIIAILFNFTFIYGSKT